MNLFTKLLELIGLNGTQAPTVVAEADECISPPSAEPQALAPETKSKRPTRKVVRDVFEQTTLELHKKSDSTQERLDALDRDLGEKLRKKNGG